MRLTSVASGSGTGTVTSVALSMPAAFSVAGSPIVAAGTFTVTFATQAANTFLAGPTAGGVAVPTFRAMVAADMVVMVGDAGAGGVQGAVPAPAAGDAAAGKFLKADGTWSVPPGSAGANTALSNLAAVAINADLNPGADAARSIGTATLRFAAINLSTGAFVFAASGDAEPTTKVLGASVEFGAGGATAPDVTLGRDTANVLTLGAGDTFRLKGGTSGTITFGAAATTTSYALTWPAAQGGASTVLTNDGAGGLTWVAAATGTVTSVGMTVPSFLSVAGSPITTTGTLAVTLATQVANTVFAGPSTGADAAPTFRALTVNDIPSIPASKILAGVLPEDSYIGLDATLSADGKSTSNAVVDGTAGAALAYGEVCYFAVADSRWELADANAASTAGGLLGICILAAAADGDPTRMLLFGTIRADAIFPALTVGAQVYLSTTPGAVQVAQPSGTDDVIRVVGFAITADSMLFQPSPDWLTHT